MPWSREALLSIVARSPALVAAQDRAGWLALFSSNAIVEDPVGAAPNPSARLGRFFDTFIAGNEIDFEVIEDLCAGNEVVRDVIIHTRLTTGLRIDVPAHLHYEIVDEGGAPRIRRLRALWDLRRRSVGALKAGPRGLWTLCAVSALMLRVQGPRATIGYSRGLVSGIFGRGRAAASRLAIAITTGDAAAASALFAEGATIEFPIGTTLGVDAWIAALGAGARLSISQATAAGWHTSFRFAIDGGAHAGADGVRGVGFLEFDPKTRAITGARFFLRDRD